MHICMLVSVLNIVLKNYKLTFVLEEKWFIRYLMCLHYHVYSTLSIWVITHLGREWWICSTNFVSG